ncbi:discoidin domain-containing protein [Ideonella sp.]|uniref:discoidin domain-containing protein n=1 Tax=Ideonella sp. TaxID=1929293 RepID=UPI0035AEF60B
MASIRKHFLLAAAWCIAWCLGTLAPAAEAAPVLLKPVAVKASATSADSRADDATDGDVNTHWVSGKFPKQWIQLDFGRPVAIGQIRLLTSQNPTGATTHTISVGDDPNHLRVVRKFSGLTSDNQWLAHSGDGQHGDRLGHARYVRITTTQSPSWVAWREIEVYQGVEYLGYFGSDFEGQFTGDPAAETAAAGANLTWIRSFDKDVIGARLVAAETVKSKSVLVLDSQLFYIDDQGKLTLRPDDERHALLDVVSRVAADHEGTIAAVYALDEPYLNGVMTGTLQDQMRRYLLQAAADLRHYFPGKPVGAIISVDPREFDLEAKYFKMFDWVGFDCYGEWAACGPVPKRSMRYLIDTLRSKLGPSQRMIATPWAFRYDDTGTGLQAQNELVDNINHWHAEVLGDGKYVAVAPFLWNSLDLNANGIPDTGAKDLPWAKERVFQMARQLLHPGDTQVFPVAVRASGSYETNYPFAATDRDNADKWNAGGPATQWIEFDLGGSRPISKVQLLTAQSPAGATAHQLYGAGHDSGTGACPAELGGYAPLGDAWVGVTDDNQWLSWKGTANIACLRVVTTQSPSWVGWREISIWRR